MFLERRSLLQKILGVCVSALLLATLWNKALLAEPQVNIWQELLTAYVDIHGGVDYQGLKRDEKKLDAYLKSFEKADPTRWISQEERLAHYINFYNAGMMWNILRYAKEKSIDLKSSKFLELEINEIEVSGGGDIWSGSYTFKLGGENVTLDNIEHQLIRGKNAEEPLKTWKVLSLDPRIHAAVNCAAISCPRVRERAYTKENVNQLLDENLSDYISSPRQFSMVSEDKMKANKIVFWYYADFDTFAKTAPVKGEKLRGAGDYLASYLNSSSPNRKQKADHLRGSFNSRNKIALQFSSSFKFEYDWRINDKRNVEKHLSKS